jgi:hypothetical protein
VDLYINTVPAAWLTCISWGETAGRGVGAVRAGGGAAVEVGGPGEEKGALGTPAGRGRLGRIATRRIRVIPGGHGYLLNLHPRPINTL